MKEATRHFAPFLLTPSFGFSVLSSVFLSLADVSFLGYFCILLYSTGLSLCFFRYFFFVLVFSVSSLAIVFFGFSNAFSFAYVNLLCSSFASVFAFLSFTSLTYTSFLFHFYPVCLPVLLFISFLVLAISFPVFL